MNTASHRKPGKTENRLSVAFMAILVIVGIGVFMRQYQINPAVVALRPESRQQERAMGTGKSALFDITNSKLTPFSLPEHFTAETLYEKINGRADLYLASGFAVLDTQRFSLDPASGKWVEVFIYDMATPENAFSVFSRQRREGARPDDIAPNAYRTENAMFMAYGNYYLELIGTDASDELQAAMGMLAAKFVQGRGSDTPAGAPGSDLFPPDGIKSGSLQLITANAFGYEQLDLVYSCEYQLDGARLTAFVSRRPDAAAASALADEYRKTLLSYGAATVDKAIPLDGAAAMIIFDTYEIVFARGRYLAGIHETESLEAAISLAGRLAAHLEGLGP